MSIRIKRIQIISNGICFGPCPAVGDGIEQHLTIRDDGQVWLSCYAWGKENNIELKEKHVIRISSEDVSDIFSLIEHAFFERNSLSRMLRDIGEWELHIYTSDNNSHSFSGSLDPSFDTFGISDVIRKALNRDDLFVLDGNPSDD